MNAALARRFLAERGLEERIAKLAADAPELSAVQRDALCAVLSAKGNGADPAVGPVCDQGSRRRGLRLQS
jgi:hypothetical protein